MFYSQGLNTHKVPMALFKENRVKLGKAMQEQGAKPDSIMLLKGGVDHHIHNSDVDYVFAQESNFQYVFGVPEPDCYGIVTMDGKGILFVPRLDPAYQVIMGEIMPPSFFKERGELDEVFFLFFPFFFLFLSSLISFLSVSFSFNFFFFSFYY